MQVCSFNIANNYKTEENGYFIGRSILMSTQNTNRGPHITYYVVTTDFDFYFFQDGNNLAAFNPFPGSCVDQW